MPANRQAPQPQEYKLIERQLEGIRHGTELGDLLMQEYEMGGMSAVNHW